MSTWLRVLVPGDEVLVIRLLALIATGWHLSLAIILVAIIQTA